MVNNKWFGVVKKQFSPFLANNQYINSNGIIYMVSSFYILVFFWYEFHIHCHKSKPRIGQFFLRALMLRKTSISIKRWQSVLTTYQLFCIFQSGLRSEMTSISVKDKILYKNVLDLPTKRRRGSWTCYDIFAHRDQIINP